VTGASLVTIFISLNNILYISHIIDCFSGSFFCYLYRLCSVLNWLTLDSAALLYEVTASVEGG
jgi:hypothetical protein